VVTANDVDILSKKFGGDGVGGIGVCWPIDFLF
jgi:hypothetical protein